jgi:hypothetical protein
LCEEARARVPEPRAATPPAERSLIDRFAPRVDSALLACEGTDLPPRPHSSRADCALRRDVFACGQTAGQNKLATNSAQSSKWWSFPMPR